MSAEQGYREGFEAGYASGFTEAVVMAGDCPTCGSPAPCDHDVPCGIGWCPLPAGHVSRHVSRGNNLMTQHT